MVARGRARRPPANECHYSLLSLQVTARPSPNGAQQRPSYRSQMAAATGSCYAVAEAATAKMSHYTNQTFAEECAFYGATVRPSAEGERTQTVVAIRAAAGERNRYGDSTPAQVRRLLGHEL